MNNGLVLLVFFVYMTSIIDVTTGNGIALPTATEKNIIKKTHCEPGDAYRMFGYDCSNMDLKEVPQRLRSSVKILDLSINRINELTKKSFRRYSDIKLLYLFENMIRSIEPGTFEHLTNLEAVDLSSNRLSDISVELFQLPRLRNLYYSDNLLSNLDLQDLERPIKAPLQKLFMASCDLRSIPDFGILPDLVYLNISYNIFNLITPQQFSPFCSLQTVIIANSSRLDVCDCRLLHTYFDERPIFTNNTLECPVFQNNVICSEPENATSNSDAFNACLVRVEEKKRDEKAKETWLRIVIGLSVFFVLFICVLYYFHRRNVKRSEKLDKQSTKLRHIHQTQNGNVEVLLSTKK